MQARPDKVRRNREQLQPHDSPARHSSENTDESANPLRLWLLDGPGDRIPFETRHLCEQPADLVQIDPKAGMINLAVLSSADDFRCSEIHADSPAAFVVLSIVADSSHVSQRLKQPGGLLDKEFQPVRTVVSLFPA